MLQRYTIVFDSRFRDRSINANTNQFTMRLPKPLRNVVCVSLSRVEAPNSAYTVNNNNHTFYFTEDYNESTGACTAVSFDVPDGIYNAMELAFQVSKGLRDNSPNGIYYTAVASSRTNKITFSVTNSTVPVGVLDNIRLLFRSQDVNNPYSLLGFNPGEVYSFDTVNGYLTQCEAPNLFNLSGEPYILIQCPELVNMQYALPDRGVRQQVPTDVFAKLDMSASTGEYVYTTGNLQRRVFSPPQQVMNVLHFSIINKDGQLIDFNGVDLSFILEFLVLAPS